VLMTANRAVDAAQAFGVDYKAEPSGELVARMAQAWIAAGKPEQGLPALQEWLAKQPDDLVALQMLIAVDLSTKRLADAEGVLKHVLDLQPNSVASMNNLAWIYQQRNDTKSQADSLALAHKAYLLSPTPQIADTLGWILTTQKKPEIALMLLRQSSQQLPTDPTVQFHYATVLRALGRNDEAASTLRPIVLGKQVFDERDAAKRMLDELSVGK